MPLAALVRKARTKHNQVKLIEEACRCLEVALGTVDALRDSKEQENSLGKRGPGDLYARRHNQLVRVKRLNILAIVLDGLDALKLVERRDQSRLSLKQLYQAVWFLAVGHFNKNGAKKTCQDGRVVQGGRLKIDFSWVRSPLLAFFSKNTRTGN